METRNRIGTGLFDQSFAFKASAAGAADGSPVLSAASRQDSAWLSTRWAAPAHAACEGCGPRSIPSGSALSAIASFIRKIVPKRFRPIGYIEHLVNTRTGGRVGSGPFAGMRYIDNAVGSAYVPKLLGIYERELNEAIDEACALSFPLIIDIGAAEGYYATGLALRNKNARIIAFEMEQEGREALQAMLELNQSVSRVEIRGKCEPAELRTILQREQRALILCDVEGDEETLLNPTVVPELRLGHLLVEMHDFIHPGVTDRVIQRFEATHQIERIWQVPRKRSEMPWRTLGTFFLPRRYLDWAVSEWRPVQMSWLWMKPRLTHGAA
jgi:hypothetical protein